MTRVDLTTIRPSWVRRGHACRSVGVKIIGLTGQRYQSEAGGHHDFHVGQSKRISVNISATADSSTPTATAGIYTVSPFSRVEDEGPGAGIGIQRMRWCIAAVIG
jgi:hypothetical protein